MGEVEGNRIGRNSENRNRGKRKKRALRNQLKLKEKKNKTDEDINKIKSDSNDVIIKFTKKVNISTIIKHNTSISMQSFH